jgi:FkbM family methyltransferase
MKTLGQKLIHFIENKRINNLLRSIGPIGDFYRSGGKPKLYEIFVDNKDIILDIGGYEGEWTEKMVIKYGCKSIIYEPVPEFAKICIDKFKFNSNIKVIKSAVGGSNRKILLSLADNGTSEFIASQIDQIEADVIDIVDILKIKDDKIGCIKINIEGGEYEVLERLISTGKIKNIKCILVQFHRQPENYENRYVNIINELEITHEVVWSHYMVWECWKLKL